MNCEYVKRVCKHCGHKLPLLFPIPRRTCKVRPVQTIKRLGDKIEDALSSVGITQDRWLEFKDIYGLPKACNCQGRKEWINTLDEKLGLGEKLGIIKLYLHW